VKVDLSQKQWSAIMCALADFSGDRGREHYDAEDLMDLHNAINDQVCFHEVDKNNITMAGCDEVVDIVCCHCAKSGTARMALTEIDWED
jgi:hypothetical protein